MSPERDSGGVTFAYVSDTQRTNCGIWETILHLHSPCIYAKSLAASASHSSRVDVDDEQI